ncbi:hypothetical protein [Maridesulfovibrio hydrothermalis]|uniref:hypothetical protein n=1 Tax=Maridesulfovibrio hydrothermalis TaxID=191026 RepID=UPI0012B667F3|nr:hypothetical protein [Maridesulfovibrio hydrothermalis]
MSTQLEQTRKAAISVVRGIVLPRISRKLLSELINAHENDYHLLGKVVGLHERTLEEDFASIKSAKELEHLRHTYCEEELENSIRSKYLIERFKNLKPMVDNITSQLSRIESEISCLGRISVDSQVLPDVIDDTLKRFGIASRNKCTAVQNQTPGEVL